MVYWGPSTLGRPRTHLSRPRPRPPLPRHRGNVSLTNLQLINALLYVMAHGYKWRRLPKHFGSWHMIYTRMNRWSKAGVLDRLFARLQAEQSSRCVSSA
jgi:transposase